MKSKSLVENPFFFYFFVGIAAIGFIYTTINLFVIGGDQFVADLNQYFSPAFSIFAALLSIQIWRSTSRREVSRTIWAYFAIGIILWMLAESIWAFYTLFLKIDVPYPSLADLFWVVGYVVLGMSLYLRYQTLQSKPTARQFTILAAASALFIFLSLFFVLPSVIESIRDAMAEGFTIASLLENILNVLYPTGDLILLVMSVFIFFTLRSGEYSLPWRFIAVGLVCSSLADLIFVYATSQGLYYPNGRVTLLTGLSDTANGLSYAIMALGLLAFHFISIQKHNTKVEFKPEEVASAYALIFTNNKNELIGCSKNVSSLTSFPPDEDLVGKPIQDVLKAEDKVLENILKRVSVRGYVNEHPLTVTDRKGVAQPVWFSALATQDSSGNYSGANIVLRVQAAIGNFEMSSESRALIQHVLTKTGAQEKINRELALAYFKLQLQTLRQLASHLGGTGVASRMDDLVNQSAQKNAWEIVISPDGVNLPDSYDLKLLSEAIPVLLAEAKAYVVDIAGEQAVEAEIAAREKLLDSDTLRLVEVNKLRAL